MTDFTCCDPITGRTTQFFSAPDESFVLDNCGTDIYVEGIHPRDTHYIDLTDPENPTPTERPAQATTLIGLVLSDLPVPCTIHIDNEAFPHDEPTVELDFPLPGTYAVRVEAFPHLDWTTSITV